MLIATDSEIVHMSTGGEIVPAHRLCDNLSARPQWWREKRRACVVGTDTRGQHCTSDCLDRSQDEAFALQVTESQIS